jgi:N-methylhydantoinase B
MNDRIDPITLEVIQNALSSIADELALVIMRAAYSNIVRDSMDYSTAVCDRHGRTIAQGLTTPVHLGSFPDAMRNLTETYAGNINAGDVFVFNDPYGSGGMHLPDFYIVKPVFIAGEIEGFVATLAHQQDVGGIAPGGMAVYATEIFQEGLRIPDPEAL